jgi:hypothetical protein
MNSLCSTCGRAACKEVFVARGYAYYSIPYMLRCLRDTSERGLNSAIVRVASSTTTYSTIKKKGRPGYYEAVWLGIDGTLPDNNGTPRNIS